MVSKMAIPARLVLTQFGDASSLTDGNAQDIKSFGIAFPDLANLIFPSGPEYS
jgi:hypothetical protein